jgi:Zn-dependent peptidase ImmA (M78 family)
MTRAQQVATSVLKGYFSKRGEWTPDEQAREFIRRITLTPSGAWRSDDLVDTAVRILELATIDVDDLVENHLQFHLSIEPLYAYDEKAGAPVFGFADLSHDEMVICERAERYQPLYRTCVAHELGHLMLHGAGNHRRRLAYSPASSKRPPEEREADEFMVALLAPPNVLLLGLAMAANQSGLHVADVLRRANTSWGHHAWRHYILPLMIDRMCLSREFIAVQMSQWRVFSRPTVEYHRTYRLPNRWRV